METFAFVDDKFYIEFVINTAQDIAYVTKRAFKGVKWNDQSTSLSIQSARKYWSQLNAA